mmetsp:Transcript_66555/g.171277  ORF Transcript_66555/g.171277 Transcript_66555/m.171277 type:complete len:313 (+) Transcript_66555:1507-2445(+)
MEISTNGSDVRPMMPVSLAGRPLASMTSICSTAMGSGDLTAISVSRGTSFLAFTMKRWGSTNVSVRTFTTDLLRNSSIMPRRKVAPRFFMPLTVSVRSGGSKKKICCAPKQGPSGISGPRTTDTVPVISTPSMESPGEGSGTPPGPVPFIVGFITKASDANSMSKSSWKDSKSSSVLLRRCVRTAFTSGGLSPGSYSTSSAVISTWSGRLRISISILSSISVLAFALMVSRMYGHMIFVILFIHSSSPSPASVRHFLLDGGMALPRRLPWLPEEPCELPSVVWDLSNMDLRDCDLVCDLPASGKHSASGPAR